MANRQTSEFYRFSDFFLQAELRGINCVQAAEALLRNVKCPASVGKVRGVRRHWQYIEPGMPERQARWKAKEEYSDLCRSLDDTNSEAIPANIIAKLEALRQIFEHPTDDWHAAPLDPLMRPVPFTEFIWFDTVGPEAESHWVDDEDDPYQSASLNWFPGLLDLHFGDERFEYSALEVDADLATQILADPEFTIPENEAALSKFSDEERKQWIKRRGRSPGGQDQAYTEYRDHPQYDGTGQPEFRKECTEIWGPSIGAPRRRSAKP